MSDKPTPRVHLGLVGGNGGRPSRKRLDYLTRALVLKLKHTEPDRSIGSIALTCGVSENSVRRILQAHTTDAKGLTRELLVSGVLDRLDEWATAARLASRKGYHQPAKDWLEAAEVVERKPAAPPVTVDARPTVVVNIPFALGAILPPAGPRPDPSPALDTHTRTIDTAREPD